MSELWKQEGNTTTVRPRWTWIALVVMVAGLVLIGAAIVATSWTTAIVGLVLLVVGGVAGLYGGFFYDVQGGGPAGQLKDAMEGKEHEFPAAGTTRSEAEVKEDVHRRWLSEDE
jgi:predicted membrane channel-forming protein YqfA (hemolysin III family)